MNPITRLKKRMGVSCGQVMDQNCCLGVAPSIDAASYIEPGIPFNPASHRIIPLPAAHEPIKMSEGFAHASAFNQPGGARPSHLVIVLSQRPLIKPRWGSLYKSQIHSTALATVGTIAGI